MELRSWVLLVFGHDTARIQELPSQPTSGLSHLAGRNHCLNYSKLQICHLILDPEQSNRTPKSYMTSWCIADADPLVQRQVAILSNNNDNAETLLGRASPRKRLC